MTAIEFITLAFAGCLLLAASVYGAGYMAMGVL